jgi:hypothetical protein
MLRRVFWIAVGAFAAVRLQRAASRVTPTGIVDQAARYFRHLVADVRAALGEGGRTRREVEVALRHQPARATAIEVRSTSLNPPGEIGARR